jgi:dihydropteroate synthase
MRFGRKDPPRLMGILNVTPDSFSDAGDFPDTERAVAHALDMIAKGATIIDVGGESTRPGADSVSVDEQLSRVIPVVERLRAVIDPQIGISIDTTACEVARAAVKAGAGMVNDISAGADEGMLALAAHYQIPIALMHMQGSPRTMQDEPRYEDVVAEVRDFLVARAEVAVKAGVRRDAIVIDPGIGFGKTRAHNLALVVNLSTLAATGYAVMLGASRKRFMGAICCETRFKDLVGATCATTVLGVQAGVKIFRVHDVRENRQAMEIALAVSATSDRS